jgi:DNA-binding response OmpR family regulator
VKALVVEDDAKVARLLSRVLQEEGFVVDACTSAADAITLGASLSYDLMVLDWMLPEGSGLDVCRTLRRKGISAPIIMLTARGEVAERVLGLEAGADDYVCKPFHVDELLARVHAVLRRSQGTVSRFAVGPLEIDRTRRAATLRGALLDLTAREFTLLAYLAQRAGQVVSRTELLAHAWEARFDPGSNLVEVHVSRIRDKLGVDAGCIETVRGQGYRLRAEGAP